MLRKTGQDRMVFKRSGEKSAQKTNDPFRPKAKGVAYIFFR